MGRSDDIIFVNYRRTDQGWPANYLSDKLERAFGKERVFVDTRDIHAGNDIPEEIENHLDRTAVLLVIVGKKWLYAHDDFGRRRIDDPDDWVRREIRTILGRPSGQVIPILIDGAKRPGPAEALPADIAGLASRKSFDIRVETSKEDFAALIDRLARDVKRQDQSVLTELSKPRKEVRDELTRLIELGQALGAQLKCSPPTSAQQISSRDSLWHQWRRMSEQTLANSFSTLEPLGWLKKIQPQHLNYQRSLTERLGLVADDVRNELEFLETMRARLCNYGVRARNE